jgi:hypothetical protein
MATWWIELPQRNALETAPGMAILETRADLVLVMGLL